MREVIVIYTHVKKADDGTPYTQTAMLKLDVEINQHTLFNAIKRIEGVVDAAEPSGWKIS